LPHPVQSASYVHLLTDRFPFLHNAQHFYFSLFLYVNLFLTRQTTPATPSLQKAAIEVRRPSTWLGPLLSFWWIRRERGWKICAVLCKKYNIYKARHWFAVEKKSARFGLWVRTLCPAESTSTVQF